MTEITTREPQTPPPSTAKSSEPTTHASRSLDRLFSIDISHALKASLPTRYDPYYRFQDKPPVYAPYTSDALEAMSQAGATTYSLTLSEDSRCWRLHELLQDENLMRQYMAGPRGWTIMLGPRGEEVLYNVEDIVAARLGIQAPSTVSYEEEEPFVPDPTNTPRPSTPWCARERTFVRATIAWGGMYEALHEQASARTQRSQSQSSGSTPSTSQERPGGMTRAVSLDTGLAGQAKKPDMVWQTPYEDAMSKEDLGEMLDRQAAQQEAARKEAKAKEVSARQAIAEYNVCETDSEDEETGTSKALFSPMASDDDEDYEDDEEESDEGVDKSNKSTTSADSPYRPAPFRAWNDISSDEEDEPVKKDKGKAKATGGSPKEAFTRPSTPAPKPAEGEDSPWRPSPYRAWNDVSDDEDVKEDVQGGAVQAIVKAISSTNELVSPFNNDTPLRGFFQPPASTVEQDEIDAPATTLAKSLFRSCADDSSEDEEEEEESQDSDADLENASAPDSSAEQSMPYEQVRTSVEEVDEDETEDDEISPDEIVPLARQPNAGRARHHVPDQFVRSSDDDGDETEEDEMPLDEIVPLARHPNRGRTRHLVADGPHWSSDDDGDDEEDSPSEGSEDGEELDHEGIASRIRSIFRKVQRETEGLRHGSSLVRSMFQRGVADYRSESEGWEQGDEDDEENSSATSTTSETLASSSSSDSEEDDDDEDDEDLDDDHHPDDNDNDNGPEQDDHADNENDGDHQDDEDNDHYDNDDDQEHGDEGGDGNDGNNGSHNDRNGQDHQRNDDDNNENDDNAGDDDDDNADDHDDNDNRGNRSRKGRAQDDGSEADDEDDGDDEDQKDDDGNFILPKGVCWIDDDGWRRITTYKSGIQVVGRSRYWRWFPRIPNKTCILSTPRPRVESKDEGDQDRQEEEPADPSKRISEFTEPTEEYHSDEEAVHGDDAYCSGIKMEYHVNRISMKLGWVVWWRCLMPIDELEVNWSVRFGERNPWGEHEEFERGHDWRRSSWI